MRTDPPPTAPSGLWRRRAKGGKMSVSDSHADLPALLAEALDWVWAIGDVKGASAALGVSSSQLVRLLAKEAAALERVNRLRASKGLGPLRNNR
mmetsp:Transcript_41713/g.135260  ORF Transcript_41713/g.135260 Transcript_41713/m.135260 type:complete len:94 (+) Transcript_41713:410-691(+)